MKHVRGEGVKTCDIHVAREGPDYAVGPLLVILIRRGGKKTGLFSAPDCKSIFTISDVQTAFQHIDIPDSSLGRINLRAAHLFIELDLVFQDDPVRSIGLLPQQQQTVPGDIGGLDG